MKRIDWLVILFIILASVFTLKDLFRPDFYTSHDGPHQVVRLYHYDQLLRQGQIPPRWVNDLNHGFGYPLFIFSYHMPWLISAPFMFFGLSVFISIKMTYLTGFILSGILMYFYQKKLFGVLPAFIGAFLYLFAPYRFSNIFVRSSIGDATAFIFPPLIFWSFDVVRSKGKLNYFWLFLYAASLSALLLTHAMLFFLYVLILSVYILYWFVFSSNRKKIISVNVLGFLMAVSLSAFYLFPSLLERNFTVFNSVMKNAFSSQSFIPISRLFYSPWGYGVVDAYEGAMSLQLGFAQWLSFLLGILLFIYLLTRKSMRNINYGFIYILIFILSVFLMLKSSAPIWQFITRFVLIDFKWRILHVTVFAAAIISGWFIYNLKILKRRLWTAFAGFFLISLSIYANRNHLKINQVLDWPVDFYLKLEKTTNSFDEYTPIWAHAGIIRENASPAEFSAPAGIRIISSTSVKKDLKLETESEGVLTLNTLYYPGWQVFINGKPVDIDYQNRGLLEFPVAKGKNIISARFEKTPMRLISDTITLSAIILLPGFLIYKKIYG